MKCTICNNDIGLVEQTITCEKCGIVFHLECWKWNLGCATTGCVNAPKHEKGTADSEAWQTYWGATTKTCPACGETIKVNEIVCPFCSEQFATTRPITIDEYKKSLDKPETESSLRRGTITLFLLSILGVPAPLTLILGGAWLQIHKNELARTLPKYYLIAICGLIISVVYCVFIAIAIVSGK